MTSTSTPSRRHMWTRFIFTCCAVTAATASFVPPDSIKSFDIPLQFCRFANQASTAETKLHDLSQGGSRIVVIANYFSGCNGGRREAFEFAQLQHDMEIEYGQEQLFFATNLVASSEGTTCAE